MQASIHEMLSFKTAYYKKIEDGAIIPSSSCAIEIIKALGISMRAGLFAWAHDSMPDDDTRLVFSVTASGERYMFPKLCLKR